MDATDLNCLVDGLIDDLAPAPRPHDEAQRTLFHLLECPRTAIDDEALLAAAERSGIPARKHLRTGTDLPVAA